MKNYKVEVFDTKEKLNSYTFYMKSDCILQVIEILNKIISKNLYWECEELE